MCTTYHIYLTLLKILFVVTKVSFFQVEILREGMKVHGELVTAALKPFHENLDKRFSEMMNQVPKQPRRQVNVIISY